MPIPFRKPTYFNFLELEDTPTSYSGQSGKAVKVKTTEDGLEFGEAKYARPATKVVAASDSLDKTNADYVCDGQDDQVEIQQAIDALPTSGGRVLLLEGTYYISDTISVMKSNVCIEGQGYGTKLYLVSGVNKTVIQVGNGATALSNIVIRKLNIDGNKSGNTSSTVNGIYLYATSTAKITKCIIENNYIHDLGGVAIYLFAVDKSIIRGNLIYSNNYHGVYVRANSDYNIVANNVVDSNGFWGIEVYVGDNNVLIGNICRSNSAGIRLHASAIRTVVMGNQCLSNSQDGIVLYQADNNLIVGNICQGNATGINVSDADSNNNYIAKNLITGNTTNFSDSGTNTIVAADTTNDNVL